MIEYQIPKSAVDFSEEIKKNYFATVAGQLNDSHQFGFLMTANRAARRAGRC
ncbi:hypothetical protein [Aggregatibacter actinomycetemcomitans]|uniref:hypothetical protein n=1 Tax=Aggregatibacter actinomycetemcomitans TaxID=714 RepID=UPI0001B9F1BD|nr:hypothetical protein [Aggregatibacter actinomycetemcomitans]KYK75945.1 IMPACT family protein [Aggregatibacter actinomycetemcomitans serotype e str. SA2149]KYK80408.1 IMPACT family protein [Aggregatibacter actinomycetemcomitans SC383s]